MPLFVDPQIFSRIACLDGRLYGVISKCDTCDLSLNECIRSHILSALASNQAIVERKLGYNLTERYHEEIQTWDGKSQIQTNWPGVEKVNVKQEIVAIDEFGPFPISPYVQENLTLSDSGNGYCVAEVSQSVLDNPSHLIIRNTSRHIYDTQEIDGYPRRSSGNWLIALVNRPEAPACDDIVHAQNCKYMYLDVDNIVCSANGYLAPFYPGTDIEIPQAKPSEIIAGNLRRFWFAPWVLVDPAFYGEEINLIAGEFHKLLPEIEIKCVREIEALPVVYAVECADCTDDFDELTTIQTGQTKLDLLHEKHGLLQLQIKDRDFCKSNNAPYKVKIFYKTSPTFFNIQDFLETIRESITYLTAAELPVEVCGCEIKTGFIATAQKAYTEIRINPVTGEAIQNLQHGNLYGQLVFTEKLGRVPRYQRLIRT